MLNGKSLEEAKEKIDHFCLEEFHPLYPLVLYFKGYYYYYKREWDVAKRNLYQAINNCKQYHLNPKPNFYSLCFSLLSSCCYYKNDINQAISYIEEGNKSFG
jgi:hypothetical protein